jgi:hypothetical protein
VSHQHLFVCVCVCVCVCFVVVCGCQSFQHFLEDYFFPSTWESKAGGSQVQVQPRQSEPLSQNQNINKRTGEIVQVIDCLLECAKALGPIPSATKKRENSPF